METNTVTPTLLVSSYDWNAYVDIGNFGSVIL